MSLSVHSLSEVGGGGGGSHLVRHHVLLHGGVGSHLRGHHGRAAMVLLLFGEVLLVHAFDITSIPPL